MSSSSVSNSTAASARLLKAPPVRAGKPPKYGTCPECSGQGGAHLTTCRHSPVAADAPSPSKLPETGVGDLFDRLVSEIAALECVLFVVSEVADDCTLESPMPLRLIPSVECSLRESIERLHALLRVIP